MDIKNTTALDIIERRETCKFCHMIDVIGQDKKMIELYMAIVKEYAIKFRTWSSEY